VGTFRLESSTLVFEWSKQAANNSATGALLECLLSLSTNDNRKILIELGIPAYVESPQINDNYIISTSIGAEYERLILTSGSELVIRTPTTIRGLFGSKAEKLEGDKNYAEVGLPLRFHHPENHNIRFELALETGDSQKLLRGTFAVRNLALDGTKTPAFRAIIHQYREFHSKLLAARSKLQMAKDAQKDLATKLKHNLSGKEKEALEHKKAAADADVSNKQYDIHVAEQKKTDLKNHVEAKVSAILQDEGLVLTLGEMFMHDGATFPKIPVQICRRFVIDETDYLVPLVQFGNAAFE